MSEEIRVNVTLSEVRVAFLVDQIVREIHVERRSHRGVTGNIYCGRVRRLLPGLQAAFIDMGLGRPGFLHAKDMPQGASDAAPRDRNGSPRLQNLHLGERLPVQVSKDPMGTKGPRLITRFSLPGRLLVLTPGVFRMAVSQKVTEESESQRLLSLLQPGRFGGCIFRTIAKFASLDELLSEQQRLEMEWEKILQRMGSAKPGACLHREPGLEYRVLRDLAGSASDILIRVDDLATLQHMKEYAAVWCPSLLDRIILHDSDVPLFDIEHAEKALQQALQRRVPLTSGGHLVFDQTEAMTTIDVNSGSRFALHRNEDAVFRINQEAVTVIAHQVRLRNLGGIIIIDFIDMTNPAQRERLLTSLIKAFSDDTAHTEFSELTRLGLVQMTRKRARESLLHTLCDPCPQCQRRGMIRTVVTVAHDIVRALQQMGDRPWTGFQIRLAPEVAGFFLEHEPEAIIQLENQMGRTVELCPDARYGRETWDILPL